MYSKSKDGIACNIREIFFYAYFGIMLMAKGIGLYEGMAAYNLCMVVSAGLLFCKLAMDNYNIWEMVCMAGKVLLGVLVWKNSGEKGPLIYILLMIGMKKISVRRVFQLGTLVWGSAFVIQVLLGVAGIRQGAFMAHDKLGLGHIMRWGLGYPHPNVLHISYVILIAFLLYVLQLEGKKLLAATGLCFVGNLYIFMYSVSYTGFLFTVVYLACNLYFCFRKEKTKAENILIQSVFPACVFFSVAGPLFFPEKLFQLCDKILNTRFSLSNYFMTEGNWSLFGDRQQEASTSFRNATLDCSYTYLLMKGGIIIFVVMCAGYILLIQKYVKEKKNKELAIIIGLLIAGVSEPFLFNTAYKNLGLIFMGSSLSDALARIESGWELRLFSSIGDRQIRIPGYGGGRFLQGMCSWMKAHRKRLILIGIAAALIFGSGYAAAADMPDSIYILKADSDGDEEVVYLDISSLPEDFHSQIVSYVDEKTPMYEFSGNILKVEYGRGIVSSGLLGACFTIGIYSLLNCCFGRKKAAIYAAGDKM